MEAQKLEEAIKVAARQMFEKSRESMDKDSLQGFLKELTLEEQVEFNTITNSQFVEAVDELFAKMESTKNLALLGIFASMSALALVGIIAGWHVGEIEDEMRAPIKKAIDARIHAMLKASLEDPALRSEEAFRKHVATALTDLGYADKKWQKKYINKKYGKKLF